MAACALLALLVLVDVAFIAGHVFLSHRQVSWHLEVDNSYPEKWQYLKWLSATIMLLALALTRRAVIYLAWAAIFLYFLIDDATLVHERLGGWLVTELRLDRLQEIYVAWFPRLFLRPQDFGELTVALIVAMAIAALLAFSWPARNAVRERTAAKRLVAWLVLFAFFAVGVDMLHIMAWVLYPPATDVIGMIEDGGEMICASILVAGLTLELTRIRAVPIIGLRRPQA